MKPDLSGEYELDHPASTLSPHAAAVESAVLRIEHREPVFRCSAKWVAGGETLMEYSFELSTDDPEAPPGENDSSRLYWQGDSLVVDFPTGTPGVTMLWRHELIDGGRRLRATEQLRGGGRDQDNVWEFVRR